MIASHFITEDFPTLKMEDTLRFASEMFAEHCIVHLPVIGADGKFEGILPAEAVLHLPDKDNTTILSCKQDLILIYVNQNLPAVDTFEILAKNELSALPVTDILYKYLGTIRADELFYRASNYHSFKEPGAIIVLNIGKRDYNLSELARIVENENAKVILVYLDYEPAQEQYKVTLKIDTLDISNILSTLERFNYQVVFTYPTNKRDDLWKDRYDLLMKILDI